MKLSISNIAWDKSEDKEVFELIKKFGFSGIELAPTKNFIDPAITTNHDCDVYLKYISSCGFSLPAMQSLLFGKPELKIFDDSKNETLEYLKKIIDLAQKLDVKVLVFGSPKNRSIGDMDRVEVNKIAIDFFAELGDYAYSKNRYFCIEPNAKEYGCDFVVNTSEAIDLIKSVDSRGFRLHIDSAVMMMNGENVEESLEASMPYMEHFHISEPFLDFIPSNKTNHQLFYEILKKIGYDKWMSIEMKNNVLHSNIEAIEKSLKFISDIYKQR